MEADFSGYATKAGLKCSDGRTILPNAFQHQDTMTVPLVWQHGHNNPENVLGHAVLENREDGVYCYAYFNGSSKATHAKELVEHKDISMMSIWANDLIERGKRVMHGVIREVSLVLSGANPGALIDNITIRHGDMDDTMLDDEAIIYTGLEFEHSNLALTHADGANSGATIQDVYDSMSPEQQEVCHFLIGQALAGDDAEDAAGTEPDMAAHSATGDGATVQEIYDSLDENQQELLHYMIGEALEGSDTAQHDNVGGYSGDYNKKGDNEMKHNVFENNDAGGSQSVLSHDDMKGIIADATRSGSLKDAVDSYALSHGIDNISTLFPEVVATSQEPNFLARRIEWVSTLLGAVNKSPFSRIKTLNADITIDEARAKGYVKGAIKNEEFFGVTRRVTTPTTIYKKQKMDRDDIVDITDFDVVVWLKNEMRIMLDEELARAILLGDGRDPSSADKINEQNIRPIASEHELFVTTLTVNLKDTPATGVTNADELIDAILANRWQYKGTGTPTLFTSETIIASFLTAKDTLGRRIYASLAEVATVLRVAAIVPVEAMEVGSLGAYGNTTIIGIIVNPVDYTVGATAGGEVNMFDFFDIDYNQQKYLIETRCCGALTRLKSALVIKNAVTSTDTVVTTVNAPTFVKATGVVTIVASTGIIYINDEDGSTMATGAQTAISAYSTITVSAKAASGYLLPSDGASRTWTFTREA